MDPLIVELVTFRMEQQEQIEDMEYFYNKFFSPFEERKEIISQFITKKERFSRDILKEIFPIVFGVQLQ